MKVRGQLKFIAMDRMAPSLHSLIADGQYRATSLNRMRWKSLIEGSSLQRNCNKEGFNTFGEGDRPNYFARIGIVANEFYDCQTPDSVIGFGTKTLHLDYSCGNVARWGGDGGNMDAPAMGYIFAGRKISLRGGGGGMGDSHMERSGCSSGMFVLTPKRYQKRQHTESETHVS